jgi:hypothetical protein
VQIDAVEQRPGESGSVHADALIGASTSVERVACISARARIGGGHHDRTGRQRGARADPGDDDLAVLERLAQRLEGGTAKFEDLVQKKHALVRERDFTGAHGISASDEPRVADGVVRATEGAVLDEPSVRRKKAGNAVNLRHGQRLVEIERW